MHSQTTKLPIVILVSGGGSNLQAIIDAATSGELPVEIRAVISNRPGVQALQRAARAGIPTEVVDHSAYDGRDRFDAVLRERIDHYRPQLVVLAGFMRILTSDFVRHYHGRMMNIHPSLLPDFRGLNTHARVLAEGTPQHGASVHFVTDELDGGPVILQAVVPVYKDDNAERLAARVLEQEHKIFPMAIDWFARGRLRMEGGRAVLDQRPLQKPCRLHADTGEVEICA